MRARNLKPGFFKNELLAALPYPARILFAGLWGLADKEGRLEDRPSRIKIEVLPYDNEDVDSLLWKLAAGTDPFIVRYVAEGQLLIWIPKFPVHNAPHYKELPSKLPPFCSTNPTVVRRSVDDRLIIDQSSTDDRSTKVVLCPLNPSSLNPESGMP